MFLYPRALKAITPIKHRKNMFLYPSALKARTPIKRKKNIFYKH